jgi:hypothetical protein
MFIKEGSLLSSQAFQRYTSGYFPFRDIRVLLFIFSSSTQLSDMHQQKTT